MATTLSMRRSLRSRSPAVERQRAVAGGQHARARERSVDVRRGIAPRVLDHEQRLFFNERFRGVDGLAQLPSRRKADRER